MRRPRHPVLPPMRRCSSYFPILAIPAVVVVLTPSSCPRWAFMWMLAFSVFVGCKWLTWASAPRTTAPAWKHFGYWLAWPGLDAVSFLGGLDSPTPVIRPTRAEWVFAAVKTAFGLILLFVGPPWLPREWLFVRGWVGMVGIVFVLHFGLFHLLSCAWRWNGVAASPLMNWPIVSTSLSEFWGRRWNTAFRDMAYRFLFQPLRKRWGPSGAVLAGFFFSGVVHDVVISWPAGGGYGGPTLYFSVQGLAIIAERSRAARRLGVGRGWRGWFFTMIAAVTPVTLLFHRPFVVEVVVPFLEFLEAR